MDGKMPAFQVPEEMRDFAEKSVDQARRAFEGFLGAAQKAVDSVDSSRFPVAATAQDMTRRSLGFAEQNMQAAFEHAKRLVRAKDVQDAMSLQAEFLKQQFAAMQQQMQELGSGVQKAAADAGSKAAHMAADATREAARGAAEISNKAADMASGKRKP